MSNAALALEGDGLVLNRYRPLRPLGTGGSGSVWLARDERTGLDVALKIVPREGKAAARAEREAAAAAQLRHPSCLRAYAFARDPRHVYIAYEFVPGRTFREALRAGELNDAAAIEACAQVCEGLAHAHARGILHRDVKPSNVLLADGDAVSVRLLDFGLARMAEAETLTAQGDVPGTLAYISPERLAGDDSTAAADVWSVGVMLWESLSGRHPFWQTSMLETARAIEQGAPRLETLRPDLPKRLLELVDRSLSLSPARRPTAAELAQALRGAAAPRRKPRRTERPERRAAGRGRACRAQPRSPAAFAAWTASALPVLSRTAGRPGSRSRPPGVTAFRPASRARARARSARSCRSATSRSGSRCSTRVLAGAAGSCSPGASRAARSSSWLGPLLAPLAALGLVPLAASGAARRPAPRRAGRRSPCSRPGSSPASAAPRSRSPGRAPARPRRRGRERPARRRRHARPGRRPPSRRSCSRPLALAAIALALPFARGPWPLGRRRRSGPRCCSSRVLAVPSAAPVPLVVAAWVDRGSSSPCGVAELHRCARG